MRWRKRQPTYTRPQILSARPLRNPAIHWEPDEQGFLVLKVPFRQSGFFRWLSRIFRLPDEHKIELDELGSLVWELCDGKHSVEAILTRVIKQSKLERREAEVALLTFLNTLLRRRYLVLLKVKKR